MAGLLAEGVSGASVCLRVAVRRRRLGRRAEHECGRMRGGAALIAAAALAGAPLAVVAATSEAFFSRGPFDVVRFTKGSTSSPDAALKPYRASVWAPKCPRNSSCASAEHPVLVYVSGFAGGMDISSYESLFEHAASHGTIVVGLDKELQLTGIVYSSLGAAVKLPTAWINSPEFDQLLSGAGAHGTQRRGTKLIGGHSAGSHVIVQHLVDAQCGEYGGVIMNSPVDGADPFGITKDFITPELGSGDKVPVVLPALHIKGGLDPTKLGGNPSCAPGNMANERFFDAWQGPIWRYDVPGVGHLDMCSNLDDLYKNQCPGAPDAALRADFQNLTAGLMAAFIDAVARGSAEGLALLNGGAGSQRGSATFARLTANNVQQQPALKCTYSPYTKVPVVAILSALAGLLLVAGVAMWLRRARRANADDALLPVATPTAGHETEAKVRPAQAAQQQDDPERDRPGADPALVARYRPQLLAIYKEVSPGDVPRVDEVLNHFLALESGLTKLNDRLQTKYGRQINPDHEYVEV